MSSLCQEVPFIGYLYILMNGFVVLALHASGIFLLRQLLSNRTPVKKLMLGVLGVTHKTGSKAKQQDDRKQRQPASQG